MPWRELSSLDNIILYQQQLLRGYEKEGKTAERALVRRRRGKQAGEIRSTARTTAKRSAGAQGSLLSAAPT